MSQTRNCGESTFPKATKATTTAADAASSRSGLRLERAKRNQTSPIASDEQHRLGARERRRAARRRGSASRGSTRRSRRRARVRSAARRSAEPRLSIWSGRPVWRVTLSDDPVRREQEERAHDRDEHGAEDPERDERLAPTAAPPDVEHGERQEHERVDLCGHGGAEHAEPEPRPSSDERRERAGDERRRPEVEAGQDHRPEEERRQRRERDPGAELDGRRARAGQRDGDERDERAAAEEHERLEDRLVVVRGAQCREEEHGQRARRVLEVEVPVGHLAVGHRSPYSW